MPDAYSQGMPLYSDFQPQIINDIYVIAANWFVNRTPFVTRVPRVGVGSTKFEIISRKVRPSSTTLGAAVADGTSTTITLADASLFMNGDVLEFATGERVQITADPNVSANTVTVVRGVEGTTAAAQTSGGTVLLIGNSRTGSEVDQNAIALKPTVVDQYCQTWQHPVQVGGSLQATTGFQTQAGVTTPLQQFQMDSLQNLMDDMERTTYYGKGDDGTSTGRPKQKGLRTLITNLITSPTNAGAYTPTDFVRDIGETSRRNGGQVDVVLVSTEFMSGLAKWGQPIERLDAGATALGVNINTFYAPFLGGLTLIEAPLLRAYTAVGLTSQLCRMRMKRNEFYNPRGNRGDAVEGDYIAEGAVEVDNPEKHVWLEGITAFSAS